MIEHLEIDTRTQRDIWLVVFTLFPYRREAQKLVLYVILRLS